MKALFCLLVVLSCISCQTKLYAPLKPVHQMTYPQIENFIYWEDVSPRDGHVVTDDVYTLPTEDWITNRLEPSLRYFLGAFDQEEYVKQSNDCDDYSKIAVVVARHIHHKEMGRTNKTSISVGEFYYFKEEGTNKPTKHAINFIVAKDSKLQPKLIFFEPQGRGIICLTSNEIYSCIFWSL